MSGLREINPLDYISWGDLLHDHRFSVTLADREPDIRPHAVMSGAERPEGGFVYPRDQSTTQRPGHWSVEI